MPHAEGYLTTHVLDTARGCPAAGISVSLYRIEGEMRSELSRTVTNSDGRSDAPLISGDEFRAGIYELVFEMGDYFADIANAETGFVGTVPVRFGVDRPGEHYHVPLLASPYGYSTYRGS